MENPVFLAIDHLRIGHIFTLPASLCLKSNNETVEDQRKEVEYIIELSV